MSSLPPVVVTGLHAADNPSPGVAVARCLAAAGRPVVGCCYSAIETGGHVPGVFQRVYRLPRPQEVGIEAFLARLSEVFRQSGAQAVIPTLEPEIMIFAEHRRQFEPLGVRCLLADPAALERTRKQSLAELGRKCGFRVPKLHPATSLVEARRRAREVGLPLMVKGTWYEAYKVEHADEIPALFRKLKLKWGLPVLLQPCANGIEAVVACLCDRPGHLARSVSLRKLGMSDQGTTWCGVTFRNEALLDGCRRLLAELEWLGPCEVEVLMDDRNGLITLIEINSRFPSWIAISEQLGTNMPGDLVRVLEGESLEADPGYPVGRAMVRQITDRVIDVSRLVQLDIGGSVDGC